MRTRRADPRALRRPDAAIAAAVAMRHRGSAMETKALLLIADIGGYTRFMKVHRINLAHAQYVVGQLLEAVIDAASPDFSLSKLEGDAALFYARTDRGQVLDVTKVVARVRAAFRERQSTLTTDRLCACEGCVGASQLTLKFVAHEGDVFFQKIKRHTELAGVDVILVHRLLKNDVPVTEYVLMSDTVHGRLSENVKVQAKPIEHDLEGIGPTRGYFVDLTELDVPVVVRPPSFWRKLKAWARMTWFSLPFFVGAKTSCDGFAHLEDITGVSKAPRALPPA